MKLVAQFLSADHFPRLETASSYWSNNRTKCLMRKQILVHAIKLYGCVDPSIVLVRSKVLWTNCNRFIFKLPLDWSNIRHWCFSVFKLFYVDYSCVSKKLPFWLTLPPWAYLVSASPGETHGLQCFVWYQYLIHGYKTNCRLITPNNPSKLSNDCMRGQLWTYVEAFLQITFMLK